MLKNKIRLGFTLAEVLITLGIIGIVAAMTIPSLNSMITKRQVEARAKVAYSTIAQALKLSEDKGNTSMQVQVSTKSQKEWFDKNLAPSLQVTSLCVQQAGCWHKSGIVKTLNNQTPTYTTSVGNNEVTIGNVTVTFKTAKGFWGNLDASVSGSNSNLFGVDAPESSLEFYLDVNGDRGPNVIGKDIYILIYNENLGTVPAGYSRTKEQVEQNCLTGNGYWCLSKLMRDGWKIDNKVWKR